MSASVLPLHHMPFRDPRVRLLADILENPEATKLPRPVVPRLAWVGRTTLVAAREKDGKSTLAAAAAAAVTVGKKFLGEATLQGSVLWVGVEEHVHDIGRRLSEFGANPNVIHVYERVHSELDAIREIAKQLSPALVVIDTLSSLVAGRVKDYSQGGGVEPCHGYPRQDCSGVERSGLG